jgi:phage shock protein A
MSVSAATLKKLEGKLKEIECAIDAMRDRLTSLENKWQETESKQAILDKSIGDKTKGAIEEIKVKLLRRN